MKFLELMRFLIFITILISTLIPTTKWGWISAIPLAKIHFYIYSLFPLNLVTCQSQSALEGMTELLIGDTGGSHMLPLRHLKLARSFPTVTGRRNTLRRKSYLFSLACTSSQMLMVSCEWHISSHIHLLHPQNTILLSWLALVCSAFDYNYLTTLSFKQ